MTDDATDTSRYYLLAPDRRNRLAQERLPACSVNTQLSSTNPTRCTQTAPSRHKVKKECPGRDLNPYEGCPSGGFKPPASADSATRASAVIVDRRQAYPVLDYNVYAATSDETLKISHKSSRARESAAPLKTLMCKMPSIMSANTAFHGRPRKATAITACPSVRYRTVRLTPTMQGGDLKTGVANPSDRARPASERAASPNWTDCDSTT